MTGPYAHSRSRVALSASLYRLYLIAAVLCEFPARATHLREAWSEASEFAREEGMRLSINIGHNYFCLALLSMSLPIAAAFAHSFGAYSASYLAMIAALVAWSYLHRG